MIAYCPHCDYANQLENDPYKTGSEIDCTCGNCGVAWVEFVGVDYMDEAHRDQEENLL